MKPEGRETDWDFASGFKTAAKLEQEQLLVGMRIPWSEAIPKPKPGDSWRVNLFRCVGPEAPERYLAWLPTGTQNQISTYLRCLERCASNRGTLSHAKAQRHEVNRSDLIASLRLCVKQLLNRQAGGPSPSRHTYQKWPDQSHSSPEFEPRSSTPSHLPDSRTAQTLPASPLVHSAIPA